MLRLIDIGKNKTITLKLKSIEVENVGKVEYTVNIFNKNKD